MVGSCCVVALGVSPGNIVGDNGVGSQALVDGFSDLGLVIIGDLGDGYVLVEFAILVDQFDLLQHTKGEALQLFVGRGVVSVSDLLDLGLVDSGLCDAELAVGPQLFLLIFGQTLVKQKSVS